MRKIPTVFVRDPETNLRHVRDEVTPSCEWVLADEGIATRKYDGTCCSFDGTAWWVRREVKPDKSPPPNFVPVERDEVTGKTVGWEPADQSGFAKFLTEAAERVGGWSEGTYELCGPKVNGNPEGYEVHVLIDHDRDTMRVDAPRDFDGLRAWLLAHEYEGIVWHHPDGRMAKLKRRDFPPSSGIEEHRP